MGIDTSKILLNGLLDYSGVKIGQGRVLLDSDFNELSDVLDRRLRAVASDVLGRATVSATTPDAFEIKAVAGGLTIGVGRLYVDGLCAECHGAPSPAAANRVLDPVLDEARFAQPVPYAAQPYYPQPAQLPTSGMHLVYLDVWKRPVTHLERPDLVETAVGVDSGARDQIAWQVRILPTDAGANATCATPDADLRGWADLIAPSTGVLTTGTYNVPPASDPCELPPTGGYRGEANQTYRVEIHTPGPPGVATFKWSRENASVGTRIVSLVNGTEVKVESLGRDDNLSFKTGDWVEFTNDYLEFALKPGEMRKIVVDAATRHITFAPALSGDLAPGPFPDSTSPAARNLRMIRWDHKGKVFSTSSGNPVEIQDLNAGNSGVIVIPAAATTFILENGVTVRFDSTGAKGFRAGDSWTFAARTTDASVELLDRARPRAIWHNYARLAMWDASAGTLTDCRQKWPPAGHDCSCTACVTAESHAGGWFTIQDAVDKVRPTGGTVCLGPGEYVLKAPVRIENAFSLRIRGQGLASRILAPVGGFRIADSFLTGIDNVFILAVGDEPAIAARNVLGLSLKQLVVTAHGRGDNNAIAISVHGLIAGLTIAENLILAEVGIQGETIGRPNPNATNGGDFQPLIVAALSIEDNIFLCGRSAVALTGDVLYFLGTRVADNQIIGCRNVALGLLGTGLEGSSVRIEGNGFSVEGDGIECTVSSWIERNKLVNTAGVQGPSTSAVKLIESPRGEGIQCQVLANQIAGWRAGIIVDARVRAGIVKLNIIEACNYGIMSSGEGSVITIENNQLLDIGRAGEPENGSIGIDVYMANSASIAGNTIRSVRPNRVDAKLCYGIVTFATRRIRIIGNELLEFAPDVFAGAAVGIFLTTPLDSCEVAHNRVERGGGGTQGNSADRWWALFIGRESDGVPASNLGGGQSMPLGNAVIFGGFTVLPGLAALLGASAQGQTPAGSATVPPAPQTAATPVSAALAVGSAPSGASVLGNVFVARGSHAIVEVTTDQCLFNDNVVEYGGGGPALAASAAVWLWAPAMLVNGNRVRGGNPSIALRTSANSAGAVRQATVLGNVTTTAIQLFSSPVPAPWAPLNLLG